MIDRARPDPEQQVLLGDRGVGLAVDDDADVLPRAVFDVATATAYDPAWAERMLEALRAASSFEDLLERLRAAGLSP